MGSRSLSVEDDALYEDMRARLGRERLDSFSKLWLRLKGRGGRPRNVLPLIPSGFLELAATSNPEECAIPHMSCGSSLGPSGRITGACVTFALTAEVTSSHKCLAALPRAGE